MKQSRSRKSVIRSMPWLVSIVILLVWEAGTQLTGISYAILPPPTEIAASFWKYREVIFEHALATLFSSMVGFALAVVAGIFTGLAIGASPVVYSGLYPLLVAFNALPKVALLPLIVLWAGIGIVPAIVTAFSLCFFPIVVNVATGLATIEPEMEDVLRSLGARRDEILIKVGIPRAMPYLFASLKVAVTLAFVGAVISETVASNEGIGALMMAASARFDVALVFAALFVIGAMAVGAYAICGMLETRMAHWAFRGASRA